MIDVISSCEAAEDDKKMALLLKEAGGLLDICD
jgi:hypothetical protein